MSSSLETSFNNQLILACNVAHIPDWEEEFKFSKKRRFRFDFAWPELKLAVEIQGGIWTNGGHSRGVGMNKDFEKNFIAVSLGWRIIFVSETQVYNGEAVKWTVTMLHKIMQAKGMEIKNEFKKRKTTPERDDNKNSENDEIHLPEFTKPSN